jgi:putative flippase GtrA
VRAQLVRYLLVGAVNTAVTLASYVLLVRAGVPAVAASVAAFGAGAVNGYRLNRRWTFRSDRQGAGTGARYLAVLLSGLAVNALGVALAVNVAELPRLAGEVLALPPATAVTFVLARSWAFAPEGGRAGRRSAVPRLR